MLNIAFKNRFYFVKPASVYDVSYPQRVFYAKIQFMETIANHEEENDRIEKAMIASAANVALEAMRDMASDLEAGDKVRERYPRIKEDQVAISVNQARLEFTGEQQDA